MRILATTLALTLLTAASAHADDRALTQEEIDGVQKAIKATGCTVADQDIEAEGKWYEADDAICDRIKYEIYLDKDFKVINRVKEDK